MARPENEVADELRNIGVDVQKPSGLLGTLAAGSIDLRTNQALASTLALDEQVVGGLGGTAVNGATIQLLALTTHRVVLIQGFSGYGQPTTESMYWRDITGLESTPPTRSYWLGLPQSASIVLRSASTALGAYFAGGTVKGDQFARTVDMIQQRLADQQRPMASPADTTGANDASPHPTLVDRLERLARLREVGALTQAEFELAKAQVLSGQPPPS